MTQSGFLRAYLAAYRDGAMAVLCILCIPVLLSWIYCLSKEAGLLGMVFTVGIIAVILAVVGDDLDKENFLGPNALKVILCLTPVLFLFLPKTAPGLSEIDGYPQLAFRLTIQVTIDLFDAVEMLDIVFDESENGHGIPKWFEDLWWQLHASVSYCLSCNLQKTNSMAKRSSRANALPLSVTLCKWCLSIWCSW